MITQIVAIPTVAQFASHKTRKGLFLKFTFHISFIAKSSIAAFTAPPIIGTKNQATGLNVPQSNNSITIWPRDNSQAMPERGLKNKPKSPETKFATTVKTAVFFQPVWKSHRMTKSSIPKLSAIIGIELTLVSVYKAGHTTFAIATELKPRTRNIVTANFFMANIVDKWKILLHFTLIAGTIFHLLKY